MLSFFLLEFLFRWSQKKKKNPDVAIVQRQQHQHQQQKKKNFPTQAIFVLAVEWNKNVCNITTDREPLKKFSEIFLNT